MMLGMFPLGSSVSERRVILPPWESLREPAAAATTALPYCDLPHTASEENETPASYVSFLELRLQSRMRLF